MDRIMWHYTRKRWNFSISTASDSISLSSPSLSLSLYLDLSLHSFPSSSFASITSNPIYLSKVVMKCCHASSCHRLYLAHIHTNVDERNKTSFFFFIHFGLQWKLNFSRSKRTRAPTQDRDMLTASIHPMYRLQSQVGDNRYVPESFSMEGTKKIKKIKTETRTKEIQSNVKTGCNQWKWHETSDLHDTWTLLISRTLYSRFSMPFVVSTFCLICPGNVYIYKTLTLRFRISMLYNRGDIRVQSESHSRHDIRFNTFFSRFFRIIYGFCVLNECFWGKINPVQWLLYYTSYEWLNILIADCLICFFEAFLFVDQTTKTFFRQIRKENRVLSPQQKFNLKCGWKTVSFSDFFGVCVCCWYRLNMYKGSGVTPYAVCSMLCSQYMNINLHGWMSLSALH